MIKVYSGRPEQLEAGYKPHLEAVFRDDQEAKKYVETWMQFYPKMDVIFWAERQ